MRVLVLIFVFAAVVYSMGWNPVATAPGSDLPAIEPGVSEELAKWRASQYSNISYKLNLTLEKMSPVLRGSMEIRVTQAAYACAEPNCPPMAIILDWRKIPGHEKKSVIFNASLNGIALAGTQYEERDDHLIFRDGVKMGENVIKLDFTSPILTSGSAITRYVDKEDGSEYIYSLFVPSDASTAFPVFDQPDLKARFQLELAKPSDWKSVTNTDILTGRRVGNVTTSGFAETKPLSTYFFAFAAGPFREVQKTFPNEYYGIGGTLPDEDLHKLREVPKGLIYVRKSQFEKFKPHVQEVFRLNREAIKYFEQYFDYKFPWPKYDLVLIPEFPFGGMEHAGATFLREQSVIFPQEPTRNDIVTRANLIFHEAAHQWFGDTVTMKWFDDLWLKEGFATFMAYKALDTIMPEMNAWKVFYERVKQAAYQTDSTRGTTAIYQPIKNLSAAKSVYGNIVYNKAPAFLRQAEFYLGGDKSFGVRDDKFQTAVRAFLKKHEFANAGWEDLVKELEIASGKDLKSWANRWIKQRGVPIVRFRRNEYYSVRKNFAYQGFSLSQSNSLDPRLSWPQSVSVFESFPRDSKNILNYELEVFQPDTTTLDPKIAERQKLTERPIEVIRAHESISPNFVFANYKDYGYGIFLLDDKSRDYVLKNIQNEKDDFLRTMMWGSLWDSVREGELDPKDYVELVLKNLATEKDEGTIQTLLSRVTIAMNYYISEPPKFVETAGRGYPVPPRNTALRTRLEDVLIDKIQNASTQGQRITYYRAFLNIASTDKARNILKLILKAASPQLSLKTKDKFDIVMRLAILGDADAPKLLADLEKTETSDDAKRYAYAARAAFATAENKAKFWNDFVNNKDISESWIEAAFVPFNSIRHSELTLPYLEKALAELPNLKRTRKIFFVNGWLGAFIGGQGDEKALGIVNKFLADNPNLDNDLRLKILENADVIERAVKIRKKFSRR